MQRGHFVQYTEVVQYLKILDSFCSVCTECSVFWNFFQYFFQTSLNQNKFCKKKDVFEVDDYIRFFSLLRTIERDCEQAQASNS